ncbi:MAG: CPBP family glutamic-type intramembrane protease [Bacilli bacterium]
MIQMRAPSFRLSPARRVLVNRGRLLADTIGVTLVRLLFPLVHAAAVSLALTVYNILAWITILTVDSTRLPEFSSTRVKQRQAWRFAFRWVSVPMLTIACLAWSFRLQVLSTSLDATHMPGFAFQAFMDELLFRNVLQPAFRKMGMSRWAAIGSQSILYAAACFIQTRSPGIACTAIVLAVFNGWIAVRYRTLWPGVAFGFAWRLFLI